MTVAIFKTNRAVREVVAVVVGIEEVAAAVGAEVVTNGIREDVIRTVASVVAAVAAVAAVATVEAAIPVAVAAVATSSRASRSRNLGRNSDRMEIRSCTKATSRFPRRASVSCGRPRAIMRRSRSMCSSRPIPSSVSACAKAA